MIYCKEREKQTEEGLCFWPDLNKVIVVSRIPLNNFMHLLTTLSGVFVHPTPTEPFTSNHITVPEITFVWQKKRIDFNDLFCKLLTFVPLLLPVVSNT